MSAQKKWSTMWHGSPIAEAYPRKSHSSQAAAYRWIREQAALIHEHRVLPAYTVNVHIDERDGQGWQLFEQVNLHEVVQVTRGDRPQASRGGLQ